MTPEKMKREHVDPPPPRSCSVTFSIGGFNIGDYRIPTDGRLNSMHHRKKTNCSQIRSANKHGTSKILLTVNKSFIHTKQHTRHPSINKKHTNSITQRTPRNKFFALSK